MGEAPPPAPGCRVCGSPVRPPFAHCFCCRSLVRQLGSPLVPVVTTTTYVVGDATHRRLRRYKDDPSAAVRTSTAAGLAADLTGWLADHTDLLTGALGGGWDAVTAVPSSRRPGPPPVEVLVTGVPVLSDAYRRLLVRGPGPLDHLTASSDGFVPAPGTDRAWLSSRRVVVVDDTLTTGARAQSAATALRSAGARSVVVLAVARVTPGVLVRAA